MNTTIPTYEALYVEYTQSILHLNAQLQLAETDRHKRMLRKSIRNCKRMLENLIQAAEAAGEPVV